MSSPSVLLLLRVVVCGSLSYSCHFRHYISIIGIGSVWEVSQLGISVSTFYRLSYLVSIRNSCLVLGILALFLCGRFDATLDHVLGEAILQPASHPGMVLVGLGIFSVVISMISLCKCLIIS